MSNVIYGPVQTHCPLAQLCRRGNEPRRRTHHQAEPDSADGQNQKPADFRPAVQAQAGLEKRPPRNLDGKTAPQGPGRIAENTNGLNAGSKPRNIARNKASSLRQPYTMTCTMNGCLRSSLGGQKIPPLRVRTTFFRFLLPDWLSIQEISGRWGNAGQFRRPWSLPLGPAAPAGACTRRGSIGEPSPGPAWTQDDTFPKSPGP